VSDSLSTESFPLWTMAPFPALVLAIAVLPIALPRLWERRGLQVLTVGLCALPVLGFFAVHARYADLREAGTSYASFVVTLGALYVTSGGIMLTGDMEAKPATNVALVLLGAVLASVVGTTGASMLLIRPLLSTNRQREHKAHLVPFFIVAVANAGGLLTPLGDPPLLVGYIGGVPFFWTLRLFPAWLLYVGTSCLALYFIDRRAYGRESDAALARDRSERSPIRVRGKRSILLLLAIVPAALLPPGYREVALVAIGATAYASTPRSLHQANGFTFAPIADVAIIFAGLFACLGPIQAALVSAAPSLPLHRGWELFWASGLLSSVLDNAPTYTAFAALARGVSAGAPSLVAGVAPWKLAAVSVGSVVMGATTYIGNGPNLMVKAIAERENFPTPGFFRYALFALAVMAPAHAIVTTVFALADR
jgi:Na+/H+ antiporter NhaD/arsenite permease-like protein